MEKIKSFYYDRLKKDICIKASIAMLNFSDSIILSSKMSTEGISISAHTIARFFGFLPHRKMYPATLRAFCNYIGFKDFEEYITYIQESEARSLLGKNGSFQGSAFSEYSFQFALEDVDINLINEHLDALNTDHEEIEKLAHLTGFIIRKSKRQNDLLNVLINHQKGRTLFYERFVDEDDPFNYYSNALQKHYLNVIETPNNKLFYYTYLIANAIYKTKPLKRDWLKEFQRLSESLDFQSLHFHELSRFFEVKILLVKDYVSQFDFNRLTTELQSTIKERNKHEQAWILSRCLRAFAHVDQIKTINSNIELLNEIEKVYNSISIESIGELIVQFFFHTISKNAIEFSPPLALNYPYTDNEYSTRICVETATRYLYVEEKEKKLLENQLIKFSLASGNKWILNCLQWNKQM